MIRNNTYWKKFYETNNAPESPTQFATFVMDYIQYELEYDDILPFKIHDIGSGNCRDTNYFKKRYNARSIDLNYPNADFIMDANEYLKNPEYRKIPKDEMITYSRFFLHTINPAELLGFLFKSRGYFFAEYRCEGDMPILYKDHYRNFIRNEHLLSNMINLGYKILHFETGQNRAVYKDEDPLVGRVIAYK